MLRKPVLTFAAFLAATAGALAASRPAPEAVARLRYDVHYLAAPSLEGRRVGSPGAALAAAFIGERFASLGLQPADGDGLFQDFTFIDAVRPGDDNDLAFRLPGDEPLPVARDSFQPLAFSASGKASGEVVFAGYGIRARDLDYDDYAGLDVTDKVVLILRFSPDGDDPTSRFQPYMALRRKASDARAAGAAALLVATGPLGATDTAPVKFSFDASFADAGLPVMGISTELATALFAGQGFSLPELQERIHQRKEPASRPLGSVASVVTDVVQERATCRNVIGLLPGNDPGLAREFLVLGAHYDHLGFGGEGSGSLVPDQRVIHPGADDNASGVAALLEIARRLTHTRPARSVLFAAFSGEERGLLGSAHFVQHLPVPRDQVVAMFNLDMVGRPGEGPALNIGGFGTAQEWPDLIAAVNDRHGLRLGTSRGGFGASDHSSFYSAEIPVLFFFTGAHEDYHRPTDSPDRLAYSAMARVTAFVADIADEVADLATRPTYQRVADEGAGERRGLRVRTGAIPEFGWEGNGFKISGVRGGSPADRAGLQGGDVILSFGGRETRNIYDYMYALGDHQPGETVTVTLQRGDAVLTLQVTLEAGGGGGR